MRRVLLGLLLLAGPSVCAQEPEPGGEPPGDLGGSTANAILSFNTQGHVGPINGLLFTPDGKRLITVGADRTLQVWDAGSGARLQVLRAPVSPHGGGTLNAA